VTSAEALRRRGHNVVVLAHEYTPAYAQAKQRNLAVIGDVNLSRNDPVSFLKNVKALGRLLKEKNFDILNPHRPEDHISLAFARGRDRNKGKLIRTVSDVRPPKSNPINRMLHEQWTDGMVYCARVCQDQYHHIFDLDAKPEAVIYSALDVEEFAAESGDGDNPYFSYSAPRIGMVARLSPNKGHRTLIEAAALVLRRYPEATFIVVGKEEEVKIAELQAYAQQQGVEKAFVFTGLLEDPRPAMSALDIGVVASTESEVISRAAQEFFTLGIPVVATRINVLPEMIEEGVNGLLIEPGNASEMAGAILRLLDSEETRHTVGQRIKDRARERHDLAAMGETTEHFLNAVLAAEQ
jgi:glycosyltransferase involved in cell wall biosynthesis